MVSNMDLHKIIDPVLRPTYIANRRSFNTVVIDPGHGGHDSGTRNRISREADINLSVGKKLRDRLKTMGYQVVMTRDTDNFIALQDRVRIANRHNNAIFISIHFCLLYTSSITGTALLASVLWVFADSFLIEKEQNSDMGRIL